MRVVDQETVLFEGHCASIFVGRQRRRKALGDPAGQAMATTELEVMARVGTATPAVQSDDVVCCKNLRCTDSYFVAQQQHRVLYMRLWPPTHFGPSWQKTEEKKTHFVCTSSLTLRYSTSADADGVSSSTLKPIYTDVGLSLLGNTWQSMSFVQRPSSTMLHAVRHTKKQNTTLTQGSTSPTSPGPTANGCKPGTPAVCRKFLW